METVDAPMTDAFPDNQSTIAQGIDNLKLCLEHQLAEINLSISRGVNEIKADLQAQIQTIHISHISLPRQGVQSNNAFGNVGTTLMKPFRSVTGMAEPAGVEVEQWKERYGSLEGRNRQLEQEKEQLRQAYEEHRAMEIKSVNETRDLRQRLAATNQRNQELQDQVTKFRDIILKKASGESQATPDSTIISTFVDLRVKIQHIVLKFCRFDREPRTIRSPALSKQREFFDLWNSDLSNPQLQKRARCKIFELLSERILCATLFGLDDADKTGGLEAGLARFEIDLNSIGPGHEVDISDWRTQTLKCASLRQDPPSRRPNRVAQHIIDFMAPVLPRRETAEEKYAELCDHTIRLCTTAFELTLLLRGSKDLYRCEIPKSGEEFVEEEADEQDSEVGRGKRPSGVKKIAFAMSGTLAKYTQHKGRIVLEKAHVVTRD